jgi:hypothetical protein
MFLKRFSAQFISMGQEPPNLVAKVLADFSDSGGFLPEIRGVAKKPSI